MAKHSFVSNENRFRHIPQKDARFLPDHQEPEITQVVYTYAMGPLVEANPIPLSKRIAKWGIIPLALSVIIGILLVCKVPVDDVLAKTVFTLTGALFFNAGIIFCGEKGALRDIRNAGKAKKNWLPLAAWMGFPGFVLIVGGLTSYPHSGIFGGIFVFLGSVMTLTAFGLANNAERSERRFGWRELLMTLLFLPAAIAFFAFFGIVGAFFSQFS